MGRRIFIYGYLNYPRGSASANYVQYLSLALKEAEYDVHIITNLNDDMPLQEMDDYLLYKDVKVIPFIMSRNKVLHYLQFHYRRGHMLVNMLKKYEVTDQDIVLLYSSDLHVHREVLKLKSKVGFKTAGCMAEWFPDSFFESRRERKSYNTLFKDVLSQHELMFPISTHIEQYLQNQGCNTMLLPIMSDAHEYPTGKKSFDKIKFIFPGNGIMKDSIEVVLKAFGLLTIEQKERVELHICGLKQRQIEDMLSPVEYRNIQEILVIHKYMTYEELISLYQEMHYLVITREENQMTLSNFPSKVPEVMCYGVVPIASRVGDYTKFYLEDGTNSLIINGNSVEACLSKIQQALLMTQSQYTEYSYHARKCSEDKFDYRNWYEKIRGALEGM